MRRLTAAPSVPNSHWSASSLKRRFPLRPEIVQPLRPLCYLIVWDRRLFAGRGHGRLLLLTRSTGGKPIFNRSTLFVIVPCLDHNEGRRIVRREILVPKAKCIRKCLPASS